jgi:hypothetical protein
MLKKRSQHFSLFFKLTTTSESRCYYSFCANWVAPEYKTCAQLHLLAKLSLTQLAKSYRFSKLHANVRGICHAD